MGEVRRYHSDVPDWRKTTVSKKGQVVGIELEVNNPKGKQLSADALDKFKPGKNPHPLAEDDSSLNNVTGVEIICPPLTLDEASTEGGYMHRLMEELKAAGTDVDPTDNYGMHINVNMEGWSAEEKLCVQYLCNRFANSGSTLGRRATGFGAYIPVFKFVRMPGGAVSVRTWPGGKHFAAHIRRATGESQPGGIDGTVIEVRLAKSTLDMDDLRIMLDYIFALRNWVKVAPRHTLACCFLDRMLVRGDGAVGVLEKMFTYWCRKNAQSVYARIKSNGEQQAKPNRLVVMQEAVKGRDINDNFAYSGLYNDKSTTSTQQAVRISDVLSKGIAIQGEFNHDGRVFASTVRPAN